MSKAMIIIILGAVVIVEGIMFLMKKGDSLFKIGILKADPNTTDMDKLMKVNGAGFTIGGILIVIGGFVWNGGNGAGKWIAIAAAVAVVVISALSVKYCKK